MVKRYDMRDFDHSIERYEDGGLVSYEDYVALAERCERLSFELQETERQWNEMAALCDFWKAQAETLGYVHPGVEETP